MVPGSNPHATSIFATTSPEAITQIKKQRTMQILEKEWNGGNTESYKN